MDNFENVLLDKMVHEVLKNYQGLRHYNIDANYCLSIFFERFGNANYVIFTNKLLQLIPSLRIYILMSENDSDKGMSLRESDPTRQSIVGMLSYSDEVVH